MYVIYISTQVPVFLKLFICTCNSLTSVWAQTSEIQCIYLFGSYVPELQPLPAYRPVPRPSGRRFLSRRWWTWGPASSRSPGCPSLPPCTCTEWRSSHQQRTGPCTGNGWAPDQSPSLARPTGTQRKLSQWISETYKLKTLDLYIVLHSIDPHVLHRKSN